MTDDTPTRRTNDDRTTHTSDTRVVEPVVVAQPSTVERPVQRTMSFWSFVAGFVFALVAGAIAIIVFFAVSDSDDDGNIQLDVPAVDVGN
jgi:hypothetical protein